MIDGDGGGVYLCITNIYGLAILQAYTLIIYGIEKKIRSISKKCILCLPTLTLSACLTLIDVICYNTVDLIYITAEGISRVINLKDLLLKLLKLQISVHA